MTSALIHDVPRNNLRNKSENIILASAFAGRKSKSPYTVLFLSLVSKQDSTSSLHHEQKFKDIIQEHYQISCCSDPQCLTKYLRKDLPLAIFIYAPVSSDAVHTCLDIIDEIAHEWRVILAMPSEATRCPGISDLIKCHGVHDVIDIDAYESTELLYSLKSLERLHQITELTPQVATKHTKKATKVQGRLIGQSAAMGNIKEQIRRLSKTDLPILITGESGTGKEEAARAVHELSAHSRGPFVPINCAALPETLIESELFGYEKGAFTGATARKIGYIEAADNGTLFLDEIGDMTVDAQTRLLRFIQEGVITRVGSTKPIKVKTRIIAATHVDLEKSIKDGHFRDDLYYRLNVLLLNMPPLRERGDDILLLASHFLEEFAKQHNRPALHLAHEAKCAITNNKWSGNVRELMSAIARAVVMCRGQTIHSSDLGLPSAATKTLLPTLTDAREQVDRKMLQQAYVYGGENIKRASEILGISRVAYYRLLKKYDMTLTTKE